MILGTIKTLFLIFSLLFTIPAFARKHVAIVTKVRGKVTKLNPGAMRASKVKRGDRLFEDTSVVTGNRSFVRIEFLDKSRLSLGPKSKIVVTQIKKKEGSVISLLKGRTRTKVKPGNSKKNKFFIKTRTAALGVRGTDFQTIYNPDNKVTNLLTYKGKVAMANLKDPAIPKAKKEVVLERDSKNRLKVTKEEVAKPLSESERLDLVLEKKKTVVVESGQFSGTLNKSKAVSQPVKINPQQLGILYSNENFIEKTSQETQIAKDASSVKKFVKLKQADQKAPLEGYFDKVTGEYAPKSGGFIDVGTGLYVPPEKDAKFDEKNQVYVPKTIGKLEVETGGYVAPKGIKLDARKGFVVDTKEKKVKENTNLVAMTSELNQGLAKELFVDDEKKKVEDTFLKYSNRELLAKDIFTISLKTYSTELTLDGNGTNNGEFIHNLEGVGELGLIWKMAGNGNLRPIIAFAMAKTDYSNNIAYQQDNKKLFDLIVGLNYYFNKRWNLVFDYTIGQENLPSNTGNGQGTLEKISISTIGAGFQGTFLTSGRFELGSELKLLTNLYKSDPSLSIRNGLGFYVSLDAGYWYKRNHHYGLSLFNEKRAFGVTGVNDSNSLTYDHIDISQGGLKLKYSYVF
jgi:hypothetical protein